MSKNNLYQIIYIVMALIITYSCVSDNVEIVKDKNGKISFKCELENGLREGKGYEYYPDGTIRTVSNWIAGVQNGELIEYFDNGKIQQFSMWKDGKLNGEAVEYSNKGYIHMIKQYTEGIPNGLWIKYYEGVPMHTIQYVVAKDYQQYANQWWVYDWSGNVKKEDSHYYSIFSEKGDSIRVGESGEIKVQLEAPLFGGYMKLVLGDFDSKFNPKDSTKLDTINCVGFEGTVKYKFDQKGLQMIQGVILDCKEANEYDEEMREYKKISKREIFFIKMFEVY